MQNSVVQARLARLPARSVEILRTAALIGRTFDMTFLAEVVGEAPEAIEEALLAAVQAELLRRGSHDALTFSHDKVRECLTAQLPPVRRRRLHGLIGRVLEAQAGQGASAPRRSRLSFHP